MSYEDKEKIRKTLKKRKIRVVEEYGQLKLVVFKNAKKTKVGYMKTDPYMHRYGIRTFCVFTEGSAFPWFQSSADQEKVPSSLVEAIQANDIEQYPLLDISKIDIDW